MRGMVEGRFAYVVEVASSRIAGQDRALVFVRRGGLVIALADGAGGTSNGALAAQAFVDAVGVTSPETSWTAVIEALDQDAPRLGHGQTTAVVLTVDAGGTNGTQPPPTSGFRTCPSVRSRGSMIAGRATTTRDRRPLRQLVRNNLVQHEESAISTRYASCFTGTVERITGLLLGTAVGDSLGLPREGLSRQRAARLYGGPLRQRLVFGRGMLSDDTEHACMTAQALLTGGDDPVRFARALAWKMRWWLLALPAAVGWGTLRAIARSWIGFSPERSGVRSAGNGAVMRAPIIGAWVDDPDRIAAFVDASTLITHRDPRARAGSLAIAIAAHHAVRTHRLDPSVVLRDIRGRVVDRELVGALDRVEEALLRDHTPARLAADLGLSRGVTGYVHHTVPICLHAWLRSPYDFRRVVGDVVSLGGDADTTGAIAGALAGGSVGASGIPADWLAISDWPRSLAWIRMLGERVTRRGTPLRIWWPFIPLRNAVFTAVVLATGLRRLLPPYSGAASDGGANV